MDVAFYETLLLTAKLAAWTTAILLLIGFPVAYFLAYRRFFLKPLVEALISMPLVLPPTVLGFYMLVAYSPQNAFGRFLEQNFDLRLAFSFEGVLLASVLFGLPFMIQPLQNGLISIPLQFERSLLYPGKIRIHHIPACAGSQYETFCYNSHSHDFCTLHWRVWSGHYGWWEYAWRNPGCFYCHL